MEKIISKKTFSRWWTVSFLEKAMEKVRKSRDIKLVTSEVRRNYLVCEPNYHTTNFFAEYSLAIEMKKIDVFLNKLVYLGLTILEVSKMGNWNIEKKQNYVKRIQITL